MLAKHLGLMQLLRIAPAKKDASPGHNQLESRHRQSECHVVLNQD